MALEHPSLDLARRMWTATAAGDAGELRAIFSDEIVWRATGNNPLSGSYRGIDRVLDFMAEVGEGVDDLRSTLNSVFVNDDGAVMLYHLSARRGEHTLDVDVFMLTVMRDERIVSVVTIPFDQQANDRFWR